MGAPGGPLAGAYLGAPQDKNKASALGAQTALFSVQREELQEGREAERQRPTGFCA